MRSTTAVALIVAALTAACNGSSATSEPSPTGTPSSTSPSPTTSSAPTTASAKPMPVGPKCVPFENGKGCLPVAQSGRADLTQPVFSKPLEINNPLHPNSLTSQVLYGGQVDGKPFRTEFTKLPYIKMINWDGKQIQAVTYQYLAFSDGRIHEVALDWFAQADDGSVWYLGEDVFNYADGLVADTHGTWQAGKSGPAAMIMPAKPKVGDVYRPENAPGIVFEEVTVKSVDQTVVGPGGPIKGAIVVSELHMDGTREDKTFAPGYGEFSTGNPKADVEIASLAMPTDARPGALPASLVAVSRAARSTFDAVATNRWTDATAAHGTLVSAWRNHKPGTDVLDRQLSRDLSALGVAIKNRKPDPARQAALRVSQDYLDQQLRYLPLTTIERARFALWIRQIAADADAGDAGSVAGDAITLKWTWDRVKPTLGPAVAASVDKQVKAVQAAANRKDLKGAARTAAAIRLHA